MVNEKIDDSVLRLFSHIERRVYVGVGVYGKVRHGRGGLTR